MGHRNSARASLAALLTVTAATAVACSGTAGDGTGAGRTESSGKAALAGTAYTSDQLRQALLTEAPGYRRNGEPDAGEYGALKAIQNFNQLQRQVSIDKTACRGNGMAGPGGPAVDKATPTAITAFAKGSGQSLTQTMIALPVDTAKKHVDARVPDGCRSFRTKVGGQWAQHRVVEAPPGHIGEGSRTVGVSTTVGGSALKSWYVVLRGRRHLTTISLIGPTATRAEAEKIARLAEAHARRILP